MQKWIIIIVMLIFSALYAHSQGQSRFDSWESILIAATNGDEEAAIMLVGFKNDIENGAEWTKESKDAYLNSVKGLIEYFSHNGWYMQEEQLISEAIDLFRKKDGNTNTPYLRKLWLYRTRFLSDIKSHEAAIATGKQGLYMCGMVSDYGTDYITLCGNIATSYFFLQDYLNAILYADEALALIEERNAKSQLEKDWDYYYIQNIRGLIFDALARYDRAIECFQEVVAGYKGSIYTPPYNMALNNLAGTYAKSGKY